MELPLRRGNKIINIFFSFYKLLSYLKPHIITIIIKNYILANFPPSTLITVFEI